MLRAMHPDVAKLVEAGRIPKLVGERLSQLAPGKFCSHKSFGAGKVIDWDLPGKKVTIDFEKSPGQVMELQFAFQKTEFVPDDDFRARKIEVIEELRSLSKSDPVELVIHLLESHGGAMSAEAMETALCGTVIPEAGFKKWWDAAKKALRESRRAVVPTKRVEPIVLRGTDQSPAAALVADFEAARDIKGMIKALEAIAADIGAFAEDTESLKRLLHDIDDAARKAARVNLAQALQLLSARDEVIGSGETLTLDPEAVLLADVIRKADLAKLAEDVGSLPTARQRAVFESFPAAFGDPWIAKIVRVFDRVGARGVTEIARLLGEHEAMPTLLLHLRTALARRSLGVDAVIWVCREREGAAAEVFTPDVGACVLNLLENDHLADGPRKTTRLQSLLNDDKTLLGDLVSAMDANESRNFARRLLDCPVFGELEKKSLMARIIKARPATAELVNGDGHKKREEALLVSWESLERKKSELDELVRVRIPQNIKDIALARSYGDLRENFEYKSAKDLQRYLGHRRHELEKDIGRARGTDFKGAEAASVNIGTIVTLRDESGATREITVLGAWDSDPEKHIVSYLSEVGKALMGLAPGQSAEVRDAGTELMQTLTVQSIRPYAP
jgi:transcription elongation GreA/GreB family factor